MSGDGAPAGNEELTRVSRVRVQVRADAFVYEGIVTLLPDTGRLQEVLNDPRPFLNLTDVSIHDTLSQTTHAAPYLALNKGAITHVVLMPEAAATEAVPTQEVEAASPETAPVSASEEASAPAPEAASPEVPGAGPKTMPGPPPLKRRGDPPTQPFPDLDEDVSDLILDDDGDDIDPADLLGASGSHSRSAPGE